MLIVGILGECSCEYTVAVSSALTSAMPRKMAAKPEETSSRFKARITALRSSTRHTVFEAVAHRNPYPAEQLPEPAWNQMILKTLFIGSTLHPVVGLDRRANPVLARMLRDYAHERWAAGRPISHELWRCVGPYAKGDMLQDLGRVLEKGTEPERAAAALALAASPDPAATGLLWAYPELSIAVSDNKLSWRKLAGLV